MWPFGEEKSTEQEKNERAYSEGREDEKKADVFDHFVHDIGSLGDCMKTDEQKSYDAGWEDQKEDDVQEFKDDWLNPF